MDANKINSVISRHEPAGVVDDFIDIVEYMIEQKMTFEQCLDMIHGDTCYVIGSDPVFESELRSVWVV